MIEVFLVEDEIVMRDDVKDSIPWEGEGLEFAGEASGGELVYPLIRKVQPDTLIMDIRMPFIDGLELSELAKKEFLRIKIIILSGYNEFDYTKQAIHIGMTDYLLKPITAARLLGAVKKVANVTEKEREDARLTDKYRLKMTGNTVLKRQRLLCDLVTGRVNFKGALEREEQVGMDLSTFFHQLILLRLISVGSAMAYSDQVVSCQEAVEERMESRQHVLVFDRGDEGWIFILTGESEREMERRTRECAANLGELAGVCKDIQHLSGIESHMSRLGDSQTSYLQAGRVFAARSFVEINQIISYSQMDGMVHRSGETIDIHSMDASEANKKTLESFLKQGTVGKAFGFVEEHFQNVGEKSCQSFMFHQYIVMNCYLYVGTFLEQLRLDMGRFPWELSNMEKVLKDDYTLGVPKGRLTKLLEEVMTLRDNQTASRYSQVLDEARVFIYDNYAREEISLNTVAAKVNINPGYFSSIFSQEMGVTFVEHLTEVRMEKAKELLMCSSLKTSEIGYEVGYKDSHYFGHLFRRTIGYTPKEYRAGGRKVL